MCAALRLRPARVLGQPLASGQVEMLLEASKSCWVMHRSNKRPAWFDVTSPLAACNSGLFRDAMI